MPKNRGISDAYRPKPISDSYSTPQKNYDFKKVVFLTKLRYKFTIISSKSIFICLNFNKGKASRFSFAN